MAVMGLLSGCLGPQQFLASKVAGPCPMGVCVPRICAAYTMQVVDGALGAQWLGAFKKYIEDPLNMLV